MSSFLGISPEVPQAESNTNWILTPAFKQNGSTLDTLHCTALSPSPAQKTVITPPCPCLATPPNTGSSRIPGPRLPVSPSSLTAQWSADPGEPYGSSFDKLCSSPAAFKSVKSAYILGCSSLHTIGLPCPIPLSGFAQLHLSLKASWSATCSQNCQSTPPLPPLPCYVMSITLIRP